MLGLAATQSPSGPGSWGTSVAWPTAGSSSRRTALSAQCTKQYSLPSDLAPSEWQLDPVVRPQTSHGSQLGEAVLIEGDWLYMYATQGSGHGLFVARAPVAAASQGDLSATEWYCEAGTWKQTGCQPENLVGLGAPEMSVHFHAPLGQYLMVVSEGFGAATVAARAADAPEGPWSEPRDVIRPPESFDGSAHVYAAKAHPELSGAELVTTYVPGAIYYPRFLKVSRR